MTRESLRFLVLCLAAIVLCLAGLVAAFGPSAPPAPAAPAAPGGLQLHP